MENYQLKHLVSKNSNGRTMIEVLIAMTLFTIGFLAVGTMLFSTARNNRAGNDITQATMFAREKIEFLKALPVKQMEKQCSDELGTEHLEGKFKRVCNVNASYADTAKTVKVTVSWRRRGQSREVVLRTLTRGNGM